MQDFKLPVLAALVAALVCLIIGPLLIPVLKRLKFGQSEREDGPQSHLSKSGTPTMGGIMMVVALIVGTLLFATNTTEYVLPSLLATTAFGLVGFLDDFIKVKVRKLGLKAYQKIIAQFGFSLVIAWYAKNTMGTSITIPFVGAEWDLGIFYIPFAMFVIIATVNSVNLTDGLDGLASGVTLIYALAMMVIFVFYANVCKNAGDVAGSANNASMAIFAGALAGACAGFLRFNTFPARVFMGDTGSMALGGAVSVMALFSKGMLFIPIMGGCFLASSVSVILQVGSYKLRKKRVFKMAPLHHHFEQLKIPETKITAMYMLITLGLCFVSLLSFV